MPYHNSHPDQPQDYTAVVLDLDAHHDLFRAVFDSSADALFLSLDDDTAHVIECNNRAVELFEAPSKNALIGSIGGSYRVRPLTNAELRQRTIDLDTHGSVCSEAKYQSFSGRTFWAEHLVKRIRVGNFTLRLTRITDIDAQKAVEQELLRNKAMLEEAQRIANIGSWEFDVQSQQILWSDQTFRLFGLEPQPTAPSLEEYLNMISDEHRERLQGVIQTTIQTGEDYVIEMQVIRRDGALRYHEGRGKAIRSENGNIVKLVGTVRDTTERHLQSKALQDSERRLQSIIDNTIAIVASIALDGVITFVSNNIRAALGYIPKEMVGVNFAVILHPEHIFQVGELLREGTQGKIKDGTVDVRLRHKNGSWLWFTITTSLVRDENGSPLHFVSLATNIEGQKQMQAKLLRSEESLIEAQRMAHLGSWYADLQSGSVEWSNELYRIVGRASTAPPMTIKEFLEIVHPDDHNVVREYLNRAVRHHEMIEAEIRIIRGSTTRWLETRVKPVLDHKGITTALFGTVWDISERKITDRQVRALNLTLEERVQERTRQLEEANRRLRSSQSNLKTLIESTQDSIWSIDRFYCLTAMNAAFYSLLTIHNQYHEPQIGDSVLERVPGATPLQWKNLYDRVLSGERFVTHLHYTLSELSFNVEISFNPIIDEQSEIVGAVIYSRDITDRLQTERDLREREQLLQLIFDTVPVGLSLTDKKGFFRRVNAEFLRITGYSAEEIEGASFEQLLPPLIVQDSAEVYFSLFEQNIAQNQGDISILRKDGSELAVDFATSLFTTATGESLAVTTIIDISLRKKAENEVRRALEQERELSALKSRFVVMVSHEFRTPLTTIRASAQLLERLRDRILPAKQLEYLHDIQQSVDTMAHLMEDVLYLGKADAKGLDFTSSSVNFASLCENIINGFEMLPENEHRIITHIIGTMPQRLWLDEKLLRHILTNLLSNALKYSLPEQSVDVHIHYMPEKEAGYGTEKSEGILRLSVKDYGIGIAEEDLRHLFEPFYRASNVGNISGTGLGLAIVKQAVEAHHGYITCESGIERGTEFVVVIPCKVS